MVEELGAELDASGGRTDFSVVECDTFEEARPSESPEVSILSDDEDYFGNFASAPRSDAAGVIFSVSESRHRSEAPLHSGTADSGDNEFGDYASAPLNIDAAGVLASVFEGVERSGEANPSAERSGDSDDFGDFARAPIVAPSSALEAVHPPGTVELGADDEISDFANASSNGDFGVSPVVSSLSQQPPASHTDAVTNAAGNVAAGIHDVNDFSDFSAVGLTSAALDFEDERDYRAVSSAKEQVLSTTVAHSASRAFSDDLSDFSGFSGAATSAAMVPTVPLVKTVGESGAGVQNVLLSVTPSALEHGMDDFSDFSASPRLECAPATSKDSEIPTHAVRAAEAMADDDQFADFGSPLQSSVSASNDDFSAAFLLVPSTHVPQAHLTDEFLSLSSAASEAFFFEASPTRIEQKLDILPTPFVRLSQVSIPASAVVLAPNIAVAFNAVETALASREFAEASAANSSMSPDDLESFYRAVFAARDTAYARGFFSTKSILVDDLPSPRSGFSEWTAAQRQEYAAAALEAIALTLAKELPPFSSFVDSSDNSPSDLGLFAQLRATPRAPVQVSPQQPAELTDAPGSIAPWQRLADAAAINTFIMQRPVTTLGRRKAQKSGSGGGAPANSLSTADLDFLDSLGGGAGAVAAAARPMAVLAPTQSVRTFPAVTAKPAASKGIAAVADFFGISRPRPSPTSSPSLNRAAAVSEMTPMWDLGFDELNRAINSFREEE
jgi:hypothetical protein